MLGPQMNGAYLQITRLELQKLSKYRSRNHCITALLLQSKKLSKRIMGFLMIVTQNKSRFKLQSSVF